MEKVSKFNSSAFYFESCKSNILGNIGLLRCLLEQLYSKELKHHWNKRKPQNITCLKEKFAQNNNIRI